MLGYIAPLVLVVALFVGAQLAFQHLWLSILVTAGVALLLPYGDLQGKPLVMRAIDLPKTIRSRKRRHLRRHRYT